MKIGVAFLAAWFAGSVAAADCPAMTASAITLPQEHAYALPGIEKKAAEMRKIGRCPRRAGWDNQRGAFFIDAEWTVGVIHLHRFVFDMAMLYEVGAIPSGFYLEEEKKASTKSQRTRKSSSSPSDDAFRVCAALRESGATTCEVDVNLTEPSYINTTMPMSMREAREMCAGVVHITKQSTDGFERSKLPWELRIFSPYSVRPIASCRLN